MSRTARKTFIERAIAEETNFSRRLLDLVDDEIDAWHQSDSTLALHEWLGMSEQDYASFVMDPTAVVRTISSRRTSETRRRRAPSVGRRRAPTPTQKSVSAN